MTWSIHGLDTYIVNFNMDNESLHDAIVRSSYHSAFMKMSQDTTEVKMTE